MMLNGAARLVRLVTRRAMIAKHVSPHILRHAFISPPPTWGIRHGW
jgi:site-specific recombinase XerD